MDKIQDTLYTLGITMRYKGYHQMVYALQLVLDEPSRASTATGKLYEAVAVHLGCSAKCVEYVSTP